MTTSVTPASTPNITPGAARQPRNHVSFEQTVRNSVTMAYCGLLKIKRTPEQLVDVTLQPIIFGLHRPSPVMDARASSSAG